MTVGDVLIFTGGFGASLVTAVSAAASGEMVLYLPAALSVSFLLWKLRDDLEIERLERRLERLDAKCDGIDLGFDSAVEALHYELFGGSGCDCCICSTERESDQ